MSHKAAKKIRALLRATLKHDESGKDAHLQREYTEDTKNRKKQLVELETGETKEIDVAYGTMRVTSDSGRGIYKMVKKAMRRTKTKPSAPKVAPPRPVEPAEPEPHVFSDLERG